jgi:hypothetical protein
VQRLFYRLELVQCLLKIDSFCFSILKNYFDSFCLCCGLAAIAWICAAVAIGCSSRAAIVAACIATASPTAATTTPASASTAAACTCCGFGLCCCHFLIAPIAACDCCCACFDLLIHDVFRFKIGLKKYLKIDVPASRQARKGRGGVFEMLPFSGLIFIGAWLL